MNQPASPHHKHDHHAHSCCGSAAAPALVQLSEKASGDAQLSRFRIEAMDCPTEQTLIQDKLGKLAGIEQLEFNLINRVLGVRHTLDGTADIERAIDSLGMKAEPIAAQDDGSAKACAIVEVKVGQRSTFGVGVHANIVTACVQALCSGVNRAMCEG
mgnify:CR=1 FL=1